MNDINQITSAEAEKALRKDTINMLWYIWETEYRAKEITFTLTKSENEGKQSIAASDNLQELKTFTVALDSPVNAVARIGIPRNTFVMDIQK